MPLAAADAILWFDPARYSGSGQLLNLGGGGAALNGTFPGGTNDPTFLPTPTLGQRLGYVFFPGAGTNQVSTPDSAALSPTGAITWDFYLLLPDYTPAGNMTLVAKDDSAGQVSYAIRINGGTGAVRVDSSPDGSTGAIVNVATAAGTGITDGTASFLRVIYVPDNGAGSRTVTIYTSTDGVNWGSPVSTGTAAGATSIFDSTSLTVVGRSPRAGNTLLGRMFRAKFYSGNIGTAAGTPALDVDFTGNTSQSTMTASTGQAMTFTRAASGVKLAVVTRAQFQFGTDDYIEVADNDLIDADTASSYTVMLLIRQFANISSGTLIAKRTGIAAGNTGWSMQGASSTTFRAEVTDGVNEWGSDSPAITLGDLSLVGFTLDRNAAAITAYANGVAGTPGFFFPLLTAANSEAMRIARLSGAGTTYLDTNVLGVWIWRRAATAAEIAAFYSAVTGSLSQSGGVGRLETRYPRKVKLTTGRVA